MSHGFSLLQGERVIWSGQRGQPTRLPGGAMGCRIAYAWGVLFFFGGIIGIPLLFIEQTRFYALGTVLVVVAIVLFYRRWRKKPAIFVTDRRLVERSLFGPTLVELAAITGYHRRIDRYYYRGSTSEVATNNIVLSLHGGGGRTIGPVLDYDELTSFLDGVISRDIDPSRLRSLDGSPAAAEQREDLFVAVSNESGGMGYGPLVIGPRGLVRFTEKLPFALESQLLTTLAWPEPAEDLEERVLFLTRRPDAGHALILDLATVDLGMEGTALRFKTKDRTEHIQLADADALRARKFVQAQRAAQQARAQQAATAAQDAASAQEAVAPDSPASES